MCDAEIPRTCKQRFKGIENFLRRVAFNLGNTPSQTEVKIISCIPIDVTDLQQKIISLEKELHDAKKDKSNKSSCVPCPSCKGGKSTGVFNTALTTSVSVCCSGSKTKLRKRSQPSSQYDNCTLNPKESNVSFVFSALSLAEQKEGSECSNQHTKKSAEQKASKGKGLFRRRKKKSNKEASRPNDQLVYYAATSHMPFIDMHSNYVPNAIEVTRKRDILSAHLSHVMRKQYDPNFGVEEYSDTSAFSRPVCRDLANPIRYDSDVCSCCHGRFQNVDNYMGKNFNYLIDSGQSHVIDYTSSNKTYYDSDLYDIVPVKEITNKNKHDTLKERTKNYIDINCWPETIRTKPRGNPVSMSYRAEIPVRHRYYKQTEPRLENHRKMLSHSKRQRHVNICNNADTSKSCSVECGFVYTKPVGPLSSKNMEIIRKKTKPVPFPRENQDMQIVSNESQIKKCKSIQLGVNMINETNTEMLEQIKSILQSVLTEVKTNTQLNKEDTPKRDAIVQKGSSQNNMPGCSTLLHSLTYNTSHNAPNSYYTPYTPHLPSGPVCYASFPYQHTKCMQNLQYLLNPCHRHPSACQYRKNSGHMPHNKPVNTAINTDGKVFQSTSEEKNNLIKDIYKSVALNMDFPTKDSSKSDYDGLRSSEDISTIKSQTKDGVSTYGSDVIKSDKEIEAFLSSVTGTALPSPHYTETSSQSEYKSVTKETATVDTKNTKTSTKSNRQFNLYRFEERNVPRRSQPDELEETDASSDEDDSDDTVMPSAEGEKVTKQKVGLFRRFFKSVKMLRRRRIPSNEQEKEEDDDDPYEESETEEYETYSESIQQSRSQSQYRGATPVRQVKKPPINIQLNGKRISTSPYMEQEERRQWAETFQERDDYSEKPGTSRSLRNKRYYSPYRKSYEVRSVALEDKLNGRDLEQDIHGLRTAVQDNSGKEKMSFLKKRKLLKCRCGERFKNLILEN